jgi:hypothetical protein
MWVGIPARAGDDAAGVALDDPAIDTRRGPEVVGVDDQILLHVPCLLSYAI